MSSRDPRRQSLHGPWRTGPEELAAQYSDRWTIYREPVQDGTHGEWVADPCRPAEDQRFTAGSIERLAEQLRHAARS